MPGLCAGLVRRESYRLARTGPVYAGVSEGQVPSEEYVAAVQLEAKRRVVVGGVRLGMVLEAALAAAPTAATGGGGGGRLAATSTVVVGGGWGTVAAGMVALAVGAAAGFGLGSRYLLCWRKRQQARTGYAVVGVL